MGAYPPTPMGDGNCAQTIEGIGFADVPRWQKCAEESEHRRLGLGPHPPVFFVRVANKGLKVGGSRKSGKYRT
jgi:hypothetical protein